MLFKKNFLWGKDTLVLYMKLLYLSVLNETTVIVLCFLHQSVLSPFKPYYNRTLLCYNVSQYQRNSLLT